VLDRSEGLARWARKSNQSLSCCSLGDYNGGTRMRGLIGEPTGSLSSQNSCVRATVYGNFCLKQYALIPVGDDTVILASTAAELAPCDIPDTLFADEMYPNPRYNLPVTN